MLRKNRTIWWAKYLERRLRVSALGKSITFNFPTWEQKETLYITSTPHPMAGVQVEKRRFWEQLV